MNFRKRRGIRLSYAEQGLIYFTCLTAGSQPSEVRQKIRALCERCGGRHAEALYEAVTTDQSITSIALRHYVDEWAIYQARKRFYEEWAKEEA